MSQTKFDIWYADPPWHFKTWSDKGRIKSPKYPTMNIGDIAALGVDIDPLLADNAALFMWTTYPFLEKAFSVVKAWGFKFRTVAFTWVKKGKAADKWHMGTGYYTRANPEICLLGVRGKMPVHPHSRPPNLVVAPRRKHSQKPWQVIKSISEMYPRTRRIELFASENSAVSAEMFGFTPLGFDIDGKNISKALRDLST